MNHLALVFSQDTVTRRYRRWFGRYIDRFRLDIGIALWWISQWDLFSEVRFTCLEQNEANAGPIYTYSKYIFQRWDRHSVTDINLAIRW